MSAAIKPIEEQNSQERGIQWATREEWKTKDLIPPMGSRSWKRKSSLLHPSLLIRSSWCFYFLLVLKTGDKSPSRKNDRHPGVSSCLLQKVQGVFTPHSALFNTSVVCKHTQACACVCHLIRELVLQMEYPSSHKLSCIANYGAFCT